MNTKLHWIAGIAAATFIGLLICGVIGSIGLLIFIIGHYAIAYPVETAWIVGILAAFAFSIWIYDVIEIYGWPWNKK
jgi:hypothetical protein